MNRNVKLTYSSTLEGSFLILTCENEISNMDTDNTDEQIFIVTCHSSGNWIPNPIELTCSSVTAAPPGIGILGV